MKEENRETKDVKAIPEAASGDAAAVSETADKASAGEVSAEGRKDSSGSSEAVSETADKASSSAVPRLDFLEEHTKVRPLNKRKLIRRTLITALMAVLFGMVACVTLVVLEPLLINRLHPPEEPEPVILPPEVGEVLPEKSSETGSEPGSEPGSTGESGAEQPEEGLPDPAAEYAQEEGEENSQEPAKESLQEHFNESWQEETEALKDPLFDYSESYIALQALTDKIYQGLATINTISSEENWLEGAVVAQGQSTGAVVAKNSRYFMVLARTADVIEAESITVTFNNGTVAPAEVRMSDPTTGISVLAASKADLDDYAVESITLAELGNSNSSSLKGGPVIALGSPMGINGSVCYGIITSTGTPIQTADSRYRLIMTDIYGSQQASGFLANLEGQIIGVINQSYNDRDVRNMISAMGISELRRTIERLSNNRKAAYLGLSTADVTTAMHEERGIPIGAYITNIAMDSPALGAGIQRGDILVSIDDIQLTSQAEYIDALSSYSPEAEVSITVMRERLGEYKSVEVTLTLGEN